MNTNLTKSFLNTKLIGIKDGNLISKIIFKEITKNPTRAKEPKTLAVMFQIDHLLLPQTLN